MVFRLAFINPARLVRSVSVLALAVSLAACGNQSTDTGETDQTGIAGEGSDKLALAEPVALTGAGASFPAPIYQRWFQELSTEYPKLRVNYQSVGSGAGVEQFLQGTVDFGASDVAMNDEEIEQVDRGVLMLPMTAGSIVLAYNLNGIENLQLPRDVYVDILLGNITNWNDPAIAAANEGVELPDEKINVIHRSDGSGTTGVFTKHLSTISPEWQEKVGEGKTVEWPTGIGAKGNEGVTAQIQQTEGAIGYVEYGYAKQNDLNYAALENQSGNFVKPTDESASKTLEAVTLPENLRAFISDPEGEESYPIVSYTWLLAYQDYPEPETAKSLEATIEYMLTEGQEIAPELGYVKLPQNVREKVAEAADVISPDYDIDVSQ
ncbi:MAG: phosphate ABC transporter substrate-binding protein PstS [Coleofasciculus sp. G1-WW12-02]|uniref:phosphate ABC transporter substrate-binding protein PstS n=1 Tax=Coleofasciculus sp. G1-WW12-02 TaxID=3068483 RepID=UPI0032FE6E8C